MCPLFLRIMCWSYHGVYLWDFWLGTCNAWCCGLRPRQFEVVHCKDADVRAYCELQVAIREHHLRTFLDVFATTDGVNNRTSRHRWYVGARAQGQGACLLSVRGSHHANTCRVLALPGVLISSTIYYGIKKSHLKFVVNSPSDWSDNNLPLIG